MCTLKDVANRAGIQPPAAGSLEACAVVLFVWRVAVLVSL